MSTKETNWEAVQYGLYESKPCRLAPAVTSCESSRKSLNLPEPALLICLCEVHHTRHLTLCSASTRLDYVYKDTCILQAEQLREKLALKESVSLVKFLSEKGGLGQKQGKLEGKMGLFGSGICSKSPWGVGRVENIASQDAFS